MFSDFLKGHKKPTRKKTYTNNLPSQYLHTSQQDIRSVELIKNSTILNLSKKQSTTKLFQRNSSKESINKGLKLLCRIKSRKIFTNPKNNFRLKTELSQRKLKIKENRRFNIKSKKKNPLKILNTLSNMSRIKKNKNNTGKISLNPSIEKTQKGLKFNLYINKTKLNSKSKKKSHNKSKKNLAEKKKEKFQFRKIHRKHYSKIFFENIKKNNQAFLKIFFKKNKKDKQLKNKINFAMHDKEGFYLSHYAVLHNNLILTKYLNLNKIDFEKGSKDKITPLMIAALKGHKEILRYLLKKVKNVNCKDVNGNTVLHYAVVKEDLECIRILLADQRVLRDVRNNDGKKSIDLAHPRVFMKINEVFRDNKIFKEIGKSDKSDKKGKNKMNKFLKKEKEKSNGIKVFSCKKLILDTNTKKKNSKRTNIRSEDKLKKVNIFSTKLNSELENLEKIDISSFIIHSQIGEGSFGEVYLIEKKKTNNLYALKVLKKTKVFEDNLKRYVMTERNVLSGINHPFIVKLRYAFQTNKFLFLVMDYHPGGDLGEYLEKEGGFSEKRARIYISEIILAIEELHRKNIIFRDLKPENVVLDNQGHALLIDFGLSKQNIRGYYKGTKSFCGSVAYLAPEMIEKKGHGKSMDWYMLGVLLYEMIVGIPPFYDDSQEVLLNNIVHKKLVLPDFFSKSIRDLLGKLLEKKPERRIGSFKGALEIKNHEFFKDINWDDVYNKKLKPPLPSSKKLNLFALKQNPVFLNSSDKRIDCINGWTFIENNNKN